MHHEAKAQRTEISTYFKAQAHQLKFLQGITLKVIKIPPYPPSQALKQTQSSYLSVPRVLEQFLTRPSHHSSAPCVLLGEGTAGQCHCSWWQGTKLCPHTWAGCARGSRAQRLPVHGQKASSLHAHALCMANKPLPCILTPCARRASPRFAHAHSCAWPKTP